MLGLYGDNGKENGNYCLGFRETNNTWFKVQGLGGWASNKYSSHRIPNSRNSLKTTFTRVRTTILKGAPVIMNWVGVLR